MIPTEFKEIPYVEGGRNFAGADCYGVVRLWLIYRGIVTLPEWGLVISKRLKECAEAYKKTADSGFVPVFEAHQDDVITCHDSTGALNHIGVIVITSTGPAVYHSSANTRRPVVSPLNSFRRLYKNTELIRYANSKSLHAKYIERH